MINRRDFLRALGFGTVAAAAAATSVFDVEKLLWLPGEKTIFLPPLIEEPVTLEWIAQEAFRLLSRNLTFAGHETCYDDRLVRFGQTVHLKRFQRDTGIYGPTGHVMITDQLSVNMPGADGSSRAQYHDRYLRPAVGNLADRIRFDRLTVFGRLKIQPGIDGHIMHNNTGDGPLLRVIEDIDWGSPDTNPDPFPSIVRLDVLGGRRRGRLA